MAAGAVNGLERIELRKKHPNFNYPDLALADKTAMHSFRKIIKKLEGMPLTSTAMEATITEAKKKRKQLGVIKKSRWRIRLETVMRSLLRRKPRPPLLESELIAPAKV